MLQLLKSQQLQPKSPTKDGSYWMFLQPQTNAFL
jgi:hypothetical protein